MVISSSCLCSRSAAVPPDMWSNTSLTKYCCFAGLPRPARAHAVRPEHLGMRAIPGLKPAPSAAKPTMQRRATGTGAGKWNLPNSFVATTISTTIPCAFLPFRCSCCGWPDNSLCRSDAACHLQGHLYARNCNPGGLKRKHADERRARPLRRQRLLTWKRP